MPSTLGTTSGSRLARGHSGKTLVKILIIIALFLILVGVIVFMVVALCNKNERMETAADDARFEIVTHDCQCAESHGYVRVQCVTTWHDMVTNLCYAVPDDGGMAEIRCKEPKHEATR